MYAVSAVHLFFDQLENPKIKMPDIVDMILKDKNYPIYKIMPAYPRFPEPVTEAFQKKLQQTLKVKERYIEALSYHELF